MLEDLSQHILDISENSLGAGATEIRISLADGEVAGRLVLEIGDNGRGMDPGFLRRVTDPFCTSRTTRRVGLGLPFLKQSAELCGGGLEIRSEKGIGTHVRAEFRTDSIDLPPLGDVPASVGMMVVLHPDVRWLFRYATPDGEWTLDSRDVLEALGDDEALRDPSVALWIREYIRENMNGIGKQEPSSPGGTQEE
jgi:hypothetical protein